VAVYASSKVKLETIEYVKSFLGVGSMRRMVTGRLTNVNVLVAFHSPSSLDVKMVFGNKGYGTIFYLRECEQLVG